MKREGELTRHNQCRGEEVCAMMGGGWILLALTLNNLGSHRMTLSK